jgi:hypothetical protein
MHESIAVLFVSLHFMSLGYLLIGGLLAGRRPYPSHHINYLRAFFVVVSLATCTGAYLRWRRRRLAAPSSGRLGNPGTVV